MNFHRKINLQGFSLIELMMVVAIIGIMSSVAIPMFSKYIKKSKSSEATTNLRKIFDGEVAYFYEEHTTGSGQLISRQFVATHLSAAWPPGVDKKLGNFSSPEWNALKFSADSPLQYIYFVDAYPFASPYPQRPAQFDVTTSPPVTLDIATLVSVVGDQDGDGVYSSFTRSAYITSGESELTVEGGVHAIDELE